MPYKTLTCEQCGSEFEGWHSSKYCGDECKYLANSVQIECEVCGDTYRVEPYRKEESRFCSTECKGENEKGQSRDKSIQHTCSFCGTEFEGGQGAKYCSDKCRQESRKVEEVCELCGDSYLVHPGNNGDDRKYCSTECANESKRDPLVTKTCEHCGEDFKVREYKLEQRNVTYCSDECSNVSQRERVTGECAHCGEEFEGIPSVVENRKYCSRECRDKARQETTTTECEHCGENFTVRPGDVKRRKYCSHHCFCEHRKQKNRVELECPVCEDSFRMQKGEWKRRKKTQDSIYCSKECSIKSQERRVEKTCKQCGEEFSVPASAGYRRYCSEECYGRSRQLVEGEYQDLRTEVYSNGHNVHQDIPEMLEEQDFECIYCGTGISEELHLDHKTPISRGGEHTRENTHLTCPGCNIQKHDKTHAEYIDWRRDNDLHVHHLATE